MLRQFNRFLFIAIITSAALYITLSNVEQATIKLGPSLTITTYAGVIYIGAFLLGCILASLLALFFGLKGHFRERKLRIQERNRQAFYEFFVKARGLMSGREWRAAKDLWERVLRQDPTNPIARVELAECLSQLGDIREALHALDEARASARHSPEVLYKAAHLNRNLGNYTAASDNIALLITEFPSRAALELGRDNAEELENFDSALEYQLQLERMGFRDEEQQRRKAELLFKQIIQQQQGQPLSSLVEALTAFLKRYPTQTLALETLGDAYLSLGKVDAAAEVFVKAAKQSPEDISKWCRVIELWLSGAPGDFITRANRAIAAAKSAAQGRHGVHLIEAELLLARTLLKANRPEDAQKTLDGLLGVASREGVRLPNETMQDCLSLRGLCLARLGQVRESAALWQEIVEPDLKPSQGAVLTPQRAEPSPALSTP